ncbi:ATP-dependent DNA ligase [Serinibacter arcticus]|uniref:DNA ligase (ATP) n=1 Tax=Serinibacter arcticus TaxID=1655435 RepID=A0A2U1ZS25_9MICO|nr:ATP-dependent DNA ligase [Serinibacter arcticus]PWD49750.1 ATP-dependent DNA ligase [Serinibacter arcticus]
MVALHTLVTTSAQVAATRSRLAKRALLAPVLAAADPAEIGLVATYLSGALRQRRTGVGWAGLQQMPPPAVEPSLTVVGVDAAFEHLATELGEGSAARRTAGVTALFAAATAEEQAFLRALVAGELRQGASASTVQDALAAAYEVPLASVQRAAMLVGSTATAATLAATGGQEALDAVTLRVGVPVQPMLAASAPDPAAAAAKVGLPAVVDVKIDGIRVQVHRRPEADGSAGVRLFTRSLDDITDRLPEIVEQVIALPATTLVLDGEVVGLRPDGTPLPFQVIASRTATSTDPVTARTRVPLSLVVFDALHVDGRDLLDETLTVRNAALADLLPAGLAVERHVVTTEAEATAVFDRAVAGRWEGVVVKKPDAPYAAGRRDAGWVKVKPRHTFDLAVVAAEWGYGRRRGWLSNLHLAARDPATGELVMLGKTFKGLTDATLAWQTEELQRREARRTGTTVFVDPPLVAEIAIDGVQVSTRYPGGIALRFARVLRYREDKTPDQVDSLADVLALSPVLDDDAAEDSVESPD